MPRPVPTLVAFILALIPAVGAAWTRGENLLTIFVPSDEEWVAYVKSDGDLKSNLWKRKGAGESDSYAVSTIHKYKQDLAAFRKAQDAPGQEHCDRFVSETLDETPTNGYPRLLWRTRCENDDGFTASILQVAVQGRDSFYHIQKTWRAEVSDAEFTTWRDLLQAVSVCDTRRKEQPCPEGFQRVGELSNQATPPDGSVTGEVQLP